MKPVEDMTVAELEWEKESIERTFDENRKIGQGISTKETVRYRRVCQRIEAESGQPVARWE